MPAKHLIIVESPTKAKTISRIMGEEFSVVASMGHLVDLPAKELGVKIEEEFAPSYTVIAGRKKMITQLRKAGKGAETIYVATDPDREGEAIGWHIKDRLFKKQKVLRVEFHEITQSAVREAFKHPREFDRQMVEAQVGRRILDRIVGYFLSPLLWKKIVRGLSAGRVQSVALRLIIERERAIRAFIPQEYWEIAANLQKKADSASFTARLTKVRGEEAKIPDQAQASAFVEAIGKERFIVREVKNRERARSSDAPFITSTMQQEAFNKLRYNATKTMIIAQQLYEGVDIGEENPVGLITYMRTDSPRVAPEAIQEARAYIGSTYGKEYLPETPNVFKVKKLAQEAHEAIRPTLIDHPPQRLQKYLSAEQYKLYELIYRRFIASQMSQARFLVTSADIVAGDFQFAASGTAVLFDGFYAAYPKDEDEEEEKKSLPPLEAQEELNLLSLEPSQHFTKPPPRYSDSSLVKALEEEGIGRPSTYAPIIMTLILRDYVRRLKGYFSPTELGEKVCDMLVEYFPQIMDIKFTALMEAELDEIEEGKAGRLKVLQDFYAPFKASLDFAQANIKKEVITTDEQCPQCGRQMVVKWGRKGKFLSCGGYPECKYSKSISSGVACPEAGCGGELLERRSRRGFFYGCSNFPKCRFTSKTLPSPKNE